MQLSTRKIVYLMLFLAVTLSVFFVYRRFKLESAFINTGWEDRYLERANRLDDEVRAAFPEIQKAIPELKHGDGIRCYNDDGYCGAGVQFYFDKKPDDLVKLKITVTGYTQKFTKLARDIYEDNQATFKIIVKLGEFGFSCWSEGGDDVIHCS